MARNPRVELRQPPTCGPESGCALRQRLRRDERHLDLLARDDRDRPRRHVATNRFHRVVTNRERVFSSARESGPELRGQAARHPSSQSLRRPNLNAAQNDRRDRRRERCRKGSLNPWSRTFGRCSRSLAPELASPERGKDQWSGQSRHTSSSALEPTRKGGQALGGEVCPGNSQSRDCRFDSGWRPFDLHQHIRITGYRSTRTDAPASSYCQISRSMEARKRYPSLTRTIINASESATEAPNSSRRL